jgi:hypothetical protein
MTQTVDSSPPWEECNKQVTETTAGVGCEGTCKRWFHKECSDVSTGDFTTLKRPSCTLLWMCRECKEDLTLMKNGKEELKALWSEIKGLKEIIKTSVSDEIDRAFKQGKEEKAKEESRPTVITKKTAPQPPRTIAVNQATWEEGQTEKKRRNG